VEGECERHLGPRRLQGGCEREQVCECGHGLRSDETGRTDHRTSCAGGHHPIRRMRGSGRVQIIAGVPSIASCGGPMAQSTERNAAPADALVVFGITGDLARVMTFRSLYRLEARGVLVCPIIGVAAQDWSVEQLRDHARECTASAGEPIDDEAFARFAARLSYVAGDFTDDATYQQVAAALGEAQRPVFYLEIPPFLFATVIKGLHDAGLTAQARVVVEKPFGHSRSSAVALNEEIHQYLDESAAAHRPLPGEDGTGRDPVPAIRQRDPRAGLEPQLRLLGADHVGRGLRRRRSRPLLRPGRRAARRRRQPPDAGRGRSSDGSAGRSRPGHTQGRDPCRVSLDA